MSTMLRCPSCARASAHGRSWAGSIMRVPRNTNWPTTHSSPAISEYGLQSSKQPVLMALLTLCSSSSVADASSTSRVF